MDNSEALLRETLETIVAMDQRRTWTATADNPETHWESHDGPCAKIARAALERLTSQPSSPADARHVAYGVVHEVAPDLGRARERLQRWCDEQGRRLDFGEMGEPIYYADVRALLAATEPAATDGDAVEPCPVCKQPTRTEPDGLIVAASPASDGGVGWQPIETAPKDGTWFLLRGRNSANRPMVPVVVTWRDGAWRDSASLRDMTALVVDVPHDGAADWMPLPTALASSSGAGGRRRDNAPRHRGTGLNPVRCTHI